jgi:ABC-type transport system involved in multi-copper enzyme maturation permease subunit
VAVLTLGVVVAFFWGTGAQPDRNLANTFFPRGLVASLVAASFIGPLLWPVLGGSWAGNEYNWGSIRLVLSRRPQRIQGVLAGLTALLAVIGITLIGVLVVGSLAGIAVASFTGHAALVSGVLSSTFLVTLAKTFLAAWYAAAFLLLLAYAAAIVFRSAAAGVAVGVGATLLQIIGIGILFSAGGFWSTVAHHLPLEYTQNLVGNVAAPAFIPGTGLARVNPTDPSIGQSITALGVMMAALLAVTFVSVRRRDVTA